MALTTTLTQKKFEIHFFLLFNIPEKSGMSHFCGKGFKAELTNGSDFSLIHSAIPFLVLLVSDALELITISSSDFTMLFDFGFLLLIPE